MIRLDYDFTHWELRSKPERSASAKFSCSGVQWRWTVRRSTTEIDQGIWTISYVGWL